MKQYSGLSIQPQADYFANYSREFKKELDFEVQRENQGKHERKKVDYF